MKFRFFYLLLPLILAGCAKSPQSELQINNSWEHQQIQLAQLTDWSLAGKLGIFTPEGRDSVNINWQQSTQGFHIRLTTFLGISVLDIQKVNDNTVIIDGTEYISDDPEQLITDLSGMVLPIEKLQQWIKGNPSEASYQLDDKHQLVSLLSGERSTGFWLINYADFRTIVHINLPHSLELTRGDVRLKFRISNWKIPAQQDSQQ